MVPTTRPKPTACVSCPAPVYTLPPWVWLRPEAVSAVVRLCGGLQMLCRQPDGGGAGADEESLKRLLFS